MIGYSDLNDLDDEQDSLIRALFERRHAIHDLPDDLDKIDEWEDFIRDCERAEFPHLIASARFEQFTTLSSGGRIPEAIEAYVKLMQLIHRHGDLVAQGNVEIFLASIANATMTAVDDPHVPLERLTRMIDLVEQEVRSRGMDLAGAFLARATVACSTGDASGTFGWLERWRAEGSEEWRPDDVGVIQMEIPLIQRFDVVAAAQTLDQRFRLLGIDATVMESADFDAPQVANLFALRAFQAVLMGDVGLAEHVTSYLLRRIGIRELEKIVVPQYLIRILEGRQEESVIAVDALLHQLDFDDTDWEEVAAAARSRIIADPHGAEGRLLQAVAQGAAAAHDRRGGTDIHARELAQVWWAGLPAAPPPDIVSDARVWNDPEERAEAILLAGWLKRTSLVHGEHPPMALRDRYAALTMEATAIIAAETDAEADALAKSLWTRAEEYRSASTRYTVALFSALRAGMKGDAVALTSLYRSAQEVLLEGDPGLSPAVRAAGENAYPTFVELAVGSPGVTWDAISGMGQREERLREQAGRPQAHLFLARAEVAVHLGQDEVLHSTLLGIRDALAAESEELDRYSVELAVVRLCAEKAPKFAQDLAQVIASEGSARQARSAYAWTLWFAAEDERAQSEMVALLDSVDGDVSDFDSLPGWVLLEGVPSSAEVRLSLAEALLEENEPLTDDDLHLITALAATLVSFAPEDPRGPHLRDRAFGLADALDARNGSALSRRRVERWWDASFRGGVA